MVVGTIRRRGKKHRASGIRGDDTQFVRLRQERSTFHAREIVRSTSIRRVAVAPLESCRSPSPMLNRIFVLYEMTNDNTVLYCTVGAAEETLLAHVHRTQPFRCTCPVHAALLGELASGDTWHECL